MEYLMKVVLNPGVPSEYRLWSENDSIRSHRERNLGNQFPVESLAAENIVNFYWQS